MHDARGVKFLYTAKQKLDVTFFYNPKLMACLHARGSGPAMGLLISSVYHVVRIPRHGGHDSMLMADSVPA